MYAGGMDKTLWALTGIMGAVCATCAVWGLTTDNGALAVWLGMYAVMTFIATAVLLWGAYLDRK